jgi:alpha-ketoglutarate-dependent taurine dioxygenase
MKSIEIPDAKSFDGRPFPPVVAPENCPDIRIWVAAHRVALLERMAGEGAVLVRGLPVTNAETFDTFVEAVGLPAFPYKDSLSNAHRISFTERVFSANEAPAELPIFLHHEMAQTPLPPSALFFFCEIPADEGGATPLCRSDILWEELCRADASFAESCERKGLRYTNVMAGTADPGSSMGRSWRSTFGAETREDAEGRLRELGYSWEWLDEDALRATTPTLPAVKVLTDGRKSFFNQLIAATQGWKDTRNDPSRAITFGDGTPLPDDGVATASAIAETLTFDLMWQPGDVCLVNNDRVMHGRRPFKGARRILAALAAA